MSPDRRDRQLGSLGKLTRVIVLAVCAPVLWVLALTWVDAMYDATWHPDRSWVTAMALGGGGALLLTIVLLFLLHLSVNLIHAACSRAGWCVPPEQAASDTRPAPSIAVKPRRPVRRAVVDERPGASAVVLVGGLIVYAAVCWPVISRRGFPEVDPFLLSFPWLWVLPLALSAPFDRLSKSRLWSLVLYALATAVIMARCHGPYARPRHVNLSEMLVFGLMFWGPIHLATAGLVETGIRLVLRHTRVFPEPSVRLVGSAAHRGPLEEPSRTCNAGPQSQRVGAARGLLLVTPSPGRLWGYFVALALMAVAFPFAFREGSLAYARWGGRRWAEEDWAKGDAFLFVREDERELTPGMLETYDAETGLMLYQIYGGVAKRTRYEAYRAVIEKKLAEFGPTPMVKYLFTKEETESLIADGRLGDVASSLLRTGRLAISTDFSTKFVLWPEAVPAGLSRETTVAEKGGVRVVITGPTVETFHPDGRRLQQFYVWLGEGARPADAAR